MRPAGALHHARSALRGWGASSGWRIQQRALRSAPPTLFYARAAGSPHGARPALYEQQCFAPRWLVCSLYSDAGASVAVAASAAEAEANGAPEASEATEQQDAQAHQLRQEQQQQWEAELEETLKLVHLLPESVRTALESHDRLYELLEVVMDLGRPPLARFPSGDLRLSDNPVTAEDLEQAVAKVGEFGGDNRAGIDATLHRISAMRNRSGRIVGLTCRVGRAITGSAELVRDLIVAGSSILFLGRPGVGKTTAIRELCRLCADELSKRVVIVDTSNEIGGDGDVPHAGIGRARRMQVADPEQQHRVMIEAVENHMPQVVVIDEIGTEAECSAARTIAQRGVQLFATAHGNELENVVKNPALSDLVGGIQSVTLGDDEAKRRGVQKSIQERAAPATFDVAVEMLDRMRWHVHTDVGAAVDAMLAGQHPGGQSRERAADGTILKYNYNPAIPSTRGGVGAKQQARSPLPDGAAVAGGGGGARSIVLSSVDDGEGALRTPPAGARGGGFVRRSVPVAGKEKGPVSGSIVTRRGRRVQLGTDSPEDALLRLHIADLDEERVWEVMTAMALHDKVYMEERPQNADAVLTLRSRAKANVKLRSAAKTASVPVYAIRSVSNANLIKAFRTLLGVDPAPGNVFKKAGGSRGGDDDGSGAASPKAPDGRRAALFGSLDSESASIDGDEDDEDADAAVREGGYEAAEGEGEEDESEDEAEAAAVGQAASGGGGAVLSSSYKSQEEREGLEEAQLAVEQIVIPLRQPVELLSRSAAVRDAQAAMISRYRLGVEVVGTGEDARLRVLPAGAAAAAEGGEGGSGGGGVGGGDDSSGDGAEANGGGGGAVAKSGGAVASGSSSGGGGGGGGDA